MTSPSKPAERSIAIENQNDKVKKPIDGAISRANIRDGELKTMAKSASASRLNELEARNSLLIETLRKREEQISYLCALNDETAIELEVLKNGNSHISRSPVPTCTTNSEIADGQQRLQKIASELLRRPWWWNLLPERLSAQMLQKRLKIRGLFDAQQYLFLNPDVADAGFDPITHYVCHGINEGRKVST